jgi:ATP-dependent RNA circularization protein (DNA/RNA ligase family)
MSEYPKIETLYERGEDFKVKPGILKNRVYGIIKSWHWTEKIDGTNIRCIWKDGKLTFGGKTNNAQIHADLIKYLYENLSAESIRRNLPEVTDMVIYGEGYGAGIQKGGVSYSPTKKLIVFDVLMDGKWWLSWENTCDIAAKLGLDVVPYMGEMTLEEATDFVRSGFISKLGIHGSAEGLVGRTVETLFDKKGARLIVKLKTKDF